MNTDPYKTLVNGLFYTVVIVEYLTSKGGNKKGTFDTYAICETHDDGVRYACELLEADYDEVTMPRGWWDHGQIVSLEGDLYGNTGWKVRVHIQEAQAKTFD